MRLITVILILLSYLSYGQNPSGWYKLDKVDRKDSLGIVKITEKLISINEVEIPVSSTQHTPQAYYYFYKGCFQGDDYRVNFIFTRRGTERIGDNRNRTYCTLIMEVVTSEVIVTTFYIYFDN